jgi:prophage tail gpP-like protein
LSQSSIILNINGIVHSGWKSVSVNLSIENLSGAFQLGMTDKWGSSPGLIQPPPREIKPTDPCTVEINGEVIITGYVDKVAPSYDALNHTIQVDGRDKAGDLVDCSVINGSGQYNNQKIENIIKNICDPFGIPVITKVDTGKAIPTFSVEQTATCFETIQKLCKMRQCLAISDGKGGLTITRSGNDAARTPLIEGQNIIVGNGDYDFTERYQKYVCKGQKQGKDTDTVNTIAQNKGVVTDEYIPRYRPLLIVAQGQADGKSCLDLAKWEATVRMGKSRRFVITVAGWKQENGELWGINKLVTIKSPWLGVTDILLIAGVNFRLDENGELTDLTLTSKEAYITLDDDSIRRGKESKDNPYIGK